MLAIAGGIMLGVIALELISRIGRNEAGTFTFAALIANALDAGLVLLVVAALAVLMLYKLDTLGIRRFEQDHFQALTWLVGFSVCVLGLWIAKKKRLW